MPSSNLLNDYIKFPVKFIFLCESAVQRQYDDLVANNVLAKCNASYIIEQTGNYQTDLSGAAFTKVNKAVIRIKGEGPIQLDISKEFIFSCEKILGQAFSLDGKNYDLLTCLVTEFVTDGDAFSIVLKEV